jgi:hypothetical protein
VQNVCGVKSVPSHVAASHVAFAVRGAIPHLPLTHVAWAHGWLAGTGQLSGVVHRGSVTWVVACFLAFLRHFFLALPDFFLQVALRLWASVAASPSTGTSSPPTAVLARRRRMVRRDVLARERARVSKVPGSMSGESFRDNERTLHSLGAWRPARMGKIPYFAGIALLDADESESVEPTIGESSTATTRPTMMVTGCSRERDSVDVFREIHTAGTSTSWRTYSPALLQRGALAVGCSPAGGAVRTRRQ